MMSVISGNGDKFSVDIQPQPTSFFLLTICTCKTPGQGTDDHLEFCPCIFVRLASIYQVFLLSCFIQYHVDHDNFAESDMAGIDIEQNVQFNIRESRTREGVVITGHKKIY